MAQVGQTGSTQNVPVNYGPQAAGTGLPEQVGKGDLEGQNIKYSRRNAGSQVLQERQQRTPVLDPPDDVKNAHFESANEDIADISEATNRAISSTISFVKNAQTGALTQEQQARLQEHSDVLKSTANYIQNLHEQGLDTPQGKNAVLSGMGLTQEQVDGLVSGKGGAANRHGGAMTLQGKRDSLKAMGFSERQIEALMALANPDDDGNVLASLHGGRGNLQNRRESLKAMGFNESQVEALLSLSDPDNGENGLASIHQPGSSAKAKLLEKGFSPEEIDRVLILSLGFNLSQTDRVLGLLKGQSLGSETQKHLLMQMGFSRDEAAILLVVADPQMLEAQDSVIQATGQEDADFLNEVVNTANALATGSPMEAKSIKQLMDLFMVMELLHEMSVRSRRTARETRAIEYDAAKQEILNQSSEMRKAAVMNLVAGVVGGTMKIASAATIMAGSTASANNPAQAQMNFQRSQAAGQAVGASGDLMSAGFQYQASLHQARQKEHEAFQKTHENAAQSSSEFMQLNQDMVKTIQSKMDEIIRSTYETLKTLTRG